MCVLYRQLSETLLAVASSMQIVAVVLQVIVSQEAMRETQIVTATAQRQFVVQEQMKKQQT